MFGTLQDILFDVSLEPCYVLNSKAKSFTKADLSFAGMALMNIYRNSSIRIERNHFKFLSNAELIAKAKQLINGSKITWRIIYYNQDKTEFYLNGIISEWKGLIDSRGTLLKPALELSNFYSGRFNSRVLFSIYNPVEDRFIRTPLTLHDTDTISSFGQELHTVLTETYLPNFLDNKEATSDLRIPIENIVMTETVLSHLPYRIQQYLMRAMDGFCIYYGSKDFPAKEYQLVALMLVAKLAHEWSATNYEEARKFQHYVFERVMRQVPLVRDNQLFIKI